jgi:hypothetical protein
MNLAAMNAFLGNAGSNVGATQLSEWASGWDTKTGQDLTAEERVLKFMEGGATASAVAGGAWAAVKTAKQGLVNGIRGGVSAGVGKAEASAAQGVVNELTVSGLTADNAMKAVVSGSDDAVRIAAGGADDAARAAARGVDDAARAAAAAEQAQPLLNNSVDGFWSSIPADAGREAAGNAQANLAFALMDRGVDPTPAMDMALNYIKNNPLEEVLRSIYQVKNLDEGRRLVGVIKANGLASTAEGIRPALTLTPNGIDTLADRLISGAN